MWTKFEVSCIKPRFIYITTRVRMVNLWQDFELSCVYLHNTEHWVIRNFSFSQHLVLRLSSSEVWVIVARLLRTWCNHSLLPWRQMHQFPPKHLYLSTRPHDIFYQNIVNITELTYRAISCEDEMCIEVACNGTMAICHFLLYNSIREKYFTASYRLTASEIMGCAFIFQSTHGHIGGAW